MRTGTINSVPPGSSPNFQGFVHDIWLLGICLENSFCCTQLQGHPPLSWERVLCGVLTSFLLWGGCGCGVSSWLDSDTLATVGPVTTSSSREGGGIRAGAFVSDCSSPLAVSEMLPDRCLCFPFGLDAFRNVPANRLIFTTGDSIPKLCKLQKRWWGQWLFINHMERHNSQSEYVWPHFIDCVHM